MGWKYSKNMRIDGEMSQDVRKEDWVKKTENNLHLHNPIWILEIPK